MFALKLSSRRYMAIWQYGYHREHDQQVFAGKDSVQCLHSPAKPARGVSVVVRSVPAEVWRREAGTSRPDYCNMQVNIFWIPLLFLCQFGSSTGLEDVQQRVVSSFTVLALSRLHTLFRIRQFEKKKKHFSICFSWSTYNTVNFTEVYSAFSGKGIYGQFWRMAIKRRDDRVRLDTILKESTGRKRVLWWTWRTRAGSLIGY